MMKCEQAFRWIHDYLDGDLSSASQKELQLHLQTCSECSREMKDLQMTEAFMSSLPKPEVPYDLEQKIIQSLPAKKKTWAGWSWVKKYPFSTVAVTFVLVMFISFMATWDQGSTLTLKTADTDQLIVKGNTVIVPPDAVIHGNVVVENGTLQVEGEVQGNVIVISGDLALASTASVSGQINEIDRALDWLWFKINNFFTQKNIE